VNRPAFLVEHQVTGAEQTRRGDTPERPRGVRALRGTAFQHWGRDRLSGSAHQRTGVVAELPCPVPVVVVVVPVVPPTVLVLSGVNRTS